MVLPLDFIKDTILKLKPSKVILTGGEVTIPWLRLLECLDFLKTLKIKTIINSNLTLVEPEALELLIQNFNITSFHTAYSDLDDEMTRLTRGGKSEDRQRLLKNIQYLLTQNVELMVKTTLTPENAGSLPRIHSYLQKLGVKHHLIECLSFSHDQKAKGKLSAQDMSTAIMEAYRNKLPGTLIEIRGCCFASSINPDNQLFLINDPEFKITHCSDRMQTAYLLADGNLRPCFMLGNKNIESNILKYNPLKIWNSSHFENIRKEKLSGNPKFACPCTSKKKFNGILVASIL